VQVGLRVAWVIKVDHHVHRHDIDTSREEISAHKTSGVAVLEVVINPADKKVKL
jgi:hypothetical protein